MKIAEHKKRISERKKQLENLIDDWRKEELFDPKAIQAYADWLPKYQPLPTEDFRPIEACPWNDTKRTRAIIRALRMLSKHPRAPKDKLQIAYERLCLELPKCENEELKWWSEVVMIRHPDLEAGACGAGAIWAAMSETVNQVAKKIIHDKGSPTND